MQVEYSFNLEAKGSEDELKRIIGALKRIENKEFDAFLEWTRVKNLKGWTKLEELADEMSIDAFLSDTDGSIEVEASGPYGHYQVLSETALFERIAESAPFAWFSGSIEGGSSYTYESIYCELKDAILHIESSFEATDEWEDEEPAVEEYDYDPVNQAYLDAGRNDPLFQGGIFTITPDDLGVSEEEYDGMSMDDVAAAIVQKEEALKTAESKADTIEFEGKVFACTGFEPSEEREIAEIVTSRGGIIKEHVSKKVDYLIVNGRAGHGTQKYNYAIELKKSGKKDITIMDGRKFFSLAR